MISYENLGDLADGRRLLVADFRGIGRAQILFNNASDRNWWVGTFDGGQQAFSWLLAGHTSGFGDLLAGHMFWTGRFGASSRDSVLFYYPGDQNWWLGTFDDRLMRFEWSLAGNTTAFGNLMAGQKFWSGRFRGSDRDEILIYDPGGRNWRLGSPNPATGVLNWTSAGNTSTFGNLLAGHKFWIGRFSRSDRDEVLMYYPGDQNWWLGSPNAATGVLNWTSAGNTSVFGNLMAGHMFWLGRFSQSSRSEILFYHPGDQNWWLGTYDAPTARLKWKRVDISSTFGNLLAGHKFWTGKFSASDRDQVLFYYPGDQNWWLSSYNTASSSFAWSRPSITDKLGNPRATFVANFARSDRSEVLVQDPDKRRWWLGTVDDDWGGFRWRMAMNTDQPRTGQASMQLRRRLRETYGRTVPGCVFYATRDGRPFADGSFGYARQPGASDGELAMTSSTIVHVGSITKFLGAVAILRLIEEWNRIVPRAANPHDSKFVKTVHQFGTPIDLDTKVLPLLRPFLDQGRINSYPSFPGTNVANITLRQLLDHQSGLPRIGEDVPRAAFMADAGVANWDDIVHEPGDDGQAHVDLAKFVTALLKQNATFANVYNNDAYSVLAAVIEATTGMPYAVWLKQHIFIEPRFGDLAPKVSDAARSARYYGFDGNGFTIGNHHPDYTDFSLAGGFYVSAAVFAEWVDAVMQKRPVGHGPVLENPELLMTERPGLGAYAIEHFRGYTKNGGAGVAGGSTNASFGFVRGYGGERILVFTECNAAVDADAVRNEGVAAITEQLSRRSGVDLTPGTAVGLRQTVLWSDGAPPAMKVATRNAAVSVKPIGVAGLIADRTRLFGEDPLAGGKNRGDTIAVELRGSLKATATGNHIFRLTSEDGSFLWLRDELIADNSGDHGMRSAESDAIWLEADTCHLLRVRWYNSGGGADLCLEWREPGKSTFAPVPASNFSPDS